MPELKVHERTALSTKQYESRARVRTLLGGVDAMREARTTYLPQRAAESDTAYNVRLKSTWLFEGYKDGVEDLTARPFRKPVQLKNEFPEKLKVFEADADAEGTSLSDFSQQVFNYGVHNGLHHILVNHPQTGEGRTLEDDLREGVRPYFEHLHDDDILGFFSLRVRGKRMLVHLRVQEFSLEPNGPFDIKEVKRVRVYDVVENDRGELRVQWKLYEEPEKGSNMLDWFVVDDGNFGDLDYIPVHTFYSNRFAFMIAYPAMQRLADKNIELWQTESMQVNSLDYARSVIYFGAGFTELANDPTNPNSGAERKIKLGGDQAVFTQNENAKFTVVEHQGKAIEAGRQRGLDIKEEMVVLGLRPMIERSQNQTATGRVMDDERSATVAEQWVRNLEKTVNAALQTAGRMARVEVPDEVFAVSEDFGLSSESKEKLDALIKAREMGDVPRDEFLQELQRYGVLRPSLDTKALATAADKEGKDKVKFEAEQQRTRLSDFPIASE